jgi:adenylate cyclase
MSQTRRLAAILAADVAGYSRLIEDEGSTLQAVKAIRAELFDQTIAIHNGRLVKTTGDGFLVEFSSIVDARRCAVEVQAGMAERDAVVPAANRSMLWLSAGDTGDGGGKGPAAARGDLGGRRRWLFAADGGG